MKLIIALTLSLAAASAQAQTLSANGIAGKPDITRLENRITTQNASFAASLAAVAGEIDALKTRLLRLENTARQLQRSHTGTAPNPSARIGATVQSAAGPDTNTQLVPVSCQAAKSCTVSCPAGFRRISQSCRGSNARFIPSNTGGSCDGPEAVSLSIMCGN